ncbi:ectoine/hydroxyectoine ABC transporter permease subunit EhuD [Neobacillus cucumis]|uniref:Ectoine/hydroxyectoine ABC transporter permease subunit EhuD n=1 Tax=Neobacillus cucumis TaxID=1740721 RepID=A0A2N5HA39_9BACI|nr:ectoine/hydroxyectoine ABC transporter permease subunit EhuD [Neobacillus cucumis]PLS02378.1 ectoine/hydroxyectoine ABC transporter permease subunit EhuD [Neobacillus cucumis]
MNLWDWNYTFEVFPVIFRAMWTTLTATITAFALAMVLGLILAVLRRVSYKPITWLVIAISEFIRATPPLVQLFFVFYVLPFYGVSLTPFVAGTLALGVHYSTYCAEIYRSGIDSVPRGQWEAATSLNFSSTQKWMKIILPQAIPPIIPMLGNYLISMFKDTPLLSAITVVEMLQAAKIAGSASFRYLEPFTIVGLLFLLLSYPSALLIKKLEVKMNRRNLGKKEKRSIEKGVAV